MSLRPYIPIDVDNLPEKFEFYFGNNSYVIKVDYNSVGEFFSIDIYDSNMVSIVIGEKLVLNKPLWSDITDKSLPFERIVPMDEAMQETVLTKENFGKTVFLYIDLISDNVADRTSGVINNGD